MTQREPEDDTELKKACDEVAAKRKAEQEAEEQRLAEHRKKAEEAMQARSNTLKKLREIGPGMSMPTKYRPHLCCRKLGKDDTEGPIHGVSFRQVGKDYTKKAEGTGDAKKTDGKAKAAEMKTADKSKGDAKKAEAKEKADDKKAGGKK